MTDDDLGHRTIAGVFRNNLWLQVVRNLAIAVLLIFAFFGACSQVCGILGFDRNRDTCTEANLGESRCTGDGSAVEKCNFREWLKMYPGFTIWGSYEWDGYLSCAAGEACVVTSNGEPVCARPNR